MGQTAIIPPPPPGFVPIEQTQSQQPNAIPPPPPGFVPIEQAPSQQQPTNDYLTKAEDFIHGAAGGALKNIPFLGKYLGGNYSQAGVVNPDVEQMGEGAGRVYEQGLEMAATGGPLKAGASALASKLPFAVKYTAPLLRIGAEALNTGGSAALHGQPVALSALFGAGGATTGEALQAVAPKIAESALGVTQKLRGHGRTIGEAILDETAAIRPSTIAQQAGQKIGDLTSELEARAQAAGQQGVTASTKPALNYLDQQIAKYQGRNSPFVAKLQDLKQQLTVNASTGQAIPQDMSPRQLLELKRGVGDAINGWEPSVKKSATPIYQQVYRLMDGELDRTVPGAADLNQKISSLIPAKSRANITANSASTTQRLIHKGMVHTGALTGAVGGFYAGGPLGAAIGFAGPEVLGSPSAQMAIARLVRQGLTPAAARALVAQQQPIQQPTLGDLLGGR